MRKILIIGAGWLGRPLAQHLSNNAQVLATNRTPKPSAAHIQPLALDLAEPFADQDINVIEQFSPEIIIGCFPPGFRSNPQPQKHPNPYLDRWEQVKKIADRLDKSKKRPLLVMTSSSAVYPEVPADMVEEDAVAGDNSVNRHGYSYTDKGAKLLAAEACITQSDYPALVLRLSGLIGPSRHPARFASRLKAVSNAAPANMVHLIDVIGAIEHCIDIALHAMESQQSRYCDTFNITSPNTCSKAEFYRASLEATLDNPSATKSLLPPILEAPGKAIRCDKLLNSGYRFRYPHALDAMRSINR